ncbi:C2H2 finger domain containing protein [Colletotrichum tofieldiae]|nr:C2H2 finger domain containing protein [Colletotrichum tofieldiae]
MASENGEVRVETSSLDERFSGLTLEDLDEEQSESFDGSEASFDSFDPTRCLFCNCHSEGLYENLDHMRKRHGMIIPYPENLIIDLETLVKYLHLVIYEYTECLYCGSVRNTPQAAQQHMTGKGHCKIDIEKEHSEFKDFYDLESNTDSKGDGFGDLRSISFVGAKEETRRLPSGKRVTHRRTKKARNHRRFDSEEDTDTFSLLEDREYSQDPKTTTSLVVDNGKKKDLVAAEKQNDLFNKQLVTMRQEDRLALMHLPVPQQRALVAKAKKQQEMWNRFESDQAIKRQCKTMAK